MVARDDDHALLALDELFELRAADRIVQRTFDNLLLRTFHTAAGRIRLQNSLEILLWNVEGDVALMVRDIQFHIASSI